MLSLVLVLALQSATGGGASAQSRPAGGVPPSGSTANGTTGGTASRPASRPAGDPSKTVKFWLDKAKGDATFLMKGLEDVLAALGAPAIPELTNALETAESDGVGPAIVCALARIQGAGALPMLEKLGSKEDSDWRAVAARGLAKIPTPASVELLWKLACDERAAVYRSAQDGLIGFVKTAPKLEVRNLVERHLARGKTVDIRVRAAMTLGRIAAPESAQALRMAIRDREADVRAAAAAALGATGTQDTWIRGELLHLLDDSDAEVQKQTILALGKLKERQACARLIELIEDDDAGIRANAYVALRAISGYSFPSMPERWKEWWKRESERVEKDPPEEKEDKEEKDG
jgi:hypothetical protein